MLNKNLVSKPAISDLQKLEVNFVSLSDTISFGIPCSLNTSFMNTWAISIAFVGYVLYSLHVCVCGCVRYDNCV
jgi:hypothetical protein